ncbi:MAG: carbamoyl-phosphate synthase large subunit [Planctomycetota bacterium]|nr:MAG: carbamoyl-phosphate synthase large subunit [Planctomycetota bacterium]
MPLDPSLKKVLIIGAGPIVIGQACEFDYSGTQACKALREEGLEVILMNSNPATIMTDPEVADRTYVEPVTWEAARAIIERERPCAVLPTLGGQTSLNVAIDLARRGVLEEFGVRLLGADVDVIERAEDRERFKEVVEGIGLESPRSRAVHSLAEALEAQQEIGLPAIVRPSFTLGGTGGGVAYNIDEFRALVDNGLRASPTHEVLVEESVIGWKEFEFEVVRDRADNCIVVCTIENVDPMGVHTGDSVTVAPALTLSDREFQRLRDASFAVLRAIGVECGGSNVQFAVDPANGALRVIEMNPRVSRSSALASKATGFPIARVAAKLALGYTLDELANDITRSTPASFEPAIDYIVTKIPRFDFEKFAGCDPTLTTSMKSVGEAMAIGRTFKESFQKALRSLERGRMGLGLDRRDDWGTERSPSRAELRSRLATPNPGRLFAVRQALLAGIPAAEVVDLTGIDPWFIGEIEDLVAFERRLKEAHGEALDPALVLEAKRLGYSDVQLATALGRSPEEVRRFRGERGLRPAYRTVDTCAAEFAARTPYFYSTWGEDSDEVPSSGKPKVVILGGGPNRIGQGIEFDCCCIHASMALREDGYETIMINSNPETVSTDYDTSDRLYFEPLTLEDVLGVIERERPLGVIVQLGGQTPLNLSLALQAAGVNILGTSPEAIHRAEDREAFAEVLERVGLARPADGTARTVEEALEVARRIGYPVMVRPSYVLGGRGMSVVHDREQLEAYVRAATEISPDHPVLIDQFLDDAIEVDVDLLADAAGAVVIGGILEHIEEAGVHSGDASCALPPYTLPPLLCDRIREASARLARELGVRGLMNVQYAVKEESIYVLEANPRASRTVPFISKATGRPLAKIAARVMVGKTLREQGVLEELAPPRFAVKKSVFPWNRFPGCEVLLGPEMRSTGEVMGMDRAFGAAFAKAQAGAGEDLATGGAVFVTVRDQDKQQVIYIAKKLASLGFEIVATRGTYTVLERHGVEPLRLVPKIHVGRPNPLDLIRNGEIALVVNTPSQQPIARRHEQEIRALSVARGIPCFTTIPAAAAAVSAIERLRAGPLGVEALQDVLLP